MTHASLAHATSSQACEEAFPVGARDPGIGAPLRFGLPPLCCALPQSLAACDRPVSRSQQFDDSYPGDSRQGEEAVKYQS
jgi:hypothetical protein